MDARIQQFDFFIQEHQVNPISTNSDLPPILDETVLVEDQRSCELDNVTKEAVVKSFFQLDDFVLGGDLAATDDFLTNIEKVISQNFLDHSSLEALAATEKSEPIAEVYQLDYGVRTYMYDVMCDEAHINFLRKVIGKFQSFKSQETGLSMIGWELVALDMKRMFPTEEHSAYSSMYTYFLRIK